MIRAGNEYAIRAHRFVAFDKTMAREDSEHSAASKDTTLQALRLSRDRRQPRSFSVLATFRLRSANRARKSFGRSTPRLAESNTADLIVGVVYCASRPRNCGSAGDFWEPLSLSRRRGKMTLRRQSAVATARSHSSAVALRYNRCRSTSIETVLWIVRRRCQEGNGTRKLKLGRIMFGPSRQSRRRQDLRSAESRPLLHPGTRFKARLIQISKMEVSKSSAKWLDGEELLGSPIIFNMVSLHPNASSACTALQQRHVRLRTDPSEAERNEPKGRQPSLTPDRSFAGRDPVNAFLAIARPAVGLRFAFFRLRWDRVRSRHRVFVAMSTCRRALDVDLTM